MQGSFSEDSLIIFNNLASQSQGLNYSESGADSYDFTRCVRPNGTAYGTGGKCRKGTEQDLFGSDGGIPTGASGGVVGGNFFPSSAKKKVTLDRALENVDESVKEWKKIAPFNKKKRAEALISAMEEFVSTDEAKKNFSALSQTAYTLYNLISLGNYSKFNKLFASREEKERLAELREKLMKLID